MKDDTISRQATIDGVKTLHDVAWKNWHEPTLSANIVLDMIRELPSAQPKRKKGKWIGADSQCGIGCPFCGMPVDDFCTSIDYIDLRYEPNFCPNCGADMRGEQDE